MNEPDSNLKDLFVGLAAAMDDGLDASLVPRMIRDVLAPEENVSQTTEQIRLDNTWEYAGTIGVDAGLCWIGDPCYILHRGQEENDPVPSDIGKDWSDFCDRHYSRSNIPMTKKEITDHAKVTGLPISYFEAHGKDSGVAQFNYDLGHEGLGVVVSTGYGDGCYSVYVQRDPNGRIARAMVEFISDNEEDEE